MLPYNRRLKAKARSLRTNPTDAEILRFDDRQALLQTESVLEAENQEMKNG